MEKSFKKREIFLNSINFFELFPNYRGKMPIIAPSNLEGYIPDEEE